MPADVLATEAADAVAEGYLAHKIKARPFVDVVAQVEAISKVTPEHYELDLDWNQMLLDVGTAAPLLQRLDGYQRTSIYETPLRQRDLEGYSRLRAKVAHPVVEHFLETPFPAAIAGEAFDGFVVSGYGVVDLLRQGTLAAEFNKRCWIQVVGTGLATALVAHLAAVLPTASWPNVTAVNTYAEDLLVESLSVRDGYLDVPTAPGLGVTVDDDALDRLRITAAVPPPPRRILTVSWPGGRLRHYADIHQLWHDCLIGVIPAYAEGADLAFREDDGSAEFTRLHERCRRAPVTDRGSA
jgi:L-alanine-DL-glutamate epimerase-like enolase superfamily enzyme